MPKVDAHVYIDATTEKDINRVKEDLGTDVIIRYRDWESRNKKTKLYQVPLEYCKYSKENGRVRDSVLSYEKNFSTLEDVNDDETQKQIENFLKSKDKKLNEDLIKAIKQQGQLEPAVITADGFLINGNRRKMALTELYKTTGKPQFGFIKTAILPGTGKPDRPTFQDLAKLENRYEVNERGKAPFSLFNKALKFLFNERTLKIPMETLLKDDPTFGVLSEKEFKIKVKKFKKDFIEPVLLMEEYLEDNNTPEDYQLVEDRYASFQEAVKIFNNLDDDNFLVKNNIKTDEIGFIKSAIFNAIKLKDYSEIDKRHNETIRKISTFINSKDCKKDIINIGKIELVHNDPNITSQKENDRAWQMNEGVKVLDLLKKCKNITERKDDQESPLDKLKLIIKHLKSKDFETKQIEKMPIPHVIEANELTNEIERLFKKVNSNFFDLKKKADKLKDLSNKKN
jgi:hypothetical protein